MDTKTQKTEDLTDFRIKATLGVTIIALCILTPFSLNNFLQGRFELGIGSVCILILCAVNAWNCFQNRYRPLLILFGLVPAVTLFLFFAFQEQGAVIAFWCYPALLGFYFMLPEKLARISNIVFLAAIFPQAWGILEQPYMIRFVVTILGVSAFSAMFLRVITTQEKILTMQAVTDPLTGLLNRKTLEDKFEEIISQNHRTGTPMTLLILDLDHFKEINDKNGHHTGDKVLRGVADFLQKRIYRRTDKIFRIGGEEFLVLLYNTNISDGVEVAEELCSGLASSPLLPNQSVTVSIGVTTLRPDDDWEDWMKRCDENLYKAKEGGRNMVVS
jgi:diguanylate cyclase (GGDEF)-like protein